MRQLSWAKIPALTESSENAGEDCCEYLSGKPRRKSAKPLPVDWAPEPKNENVPLATRLGSCFTLNLVYCPPTFRVWLPRTFEKLSFASYVLFTWPSEKGFVPTVNVLKYRVSTPSYLGNPG